VKLDWKRLGYGEDAILGDFDGGDGVRFSLVHMPTCYRRGTWRLLIEVASGPGHELWGCFDMADEPQRWYHQREAALSEAQIIADVLWNGRQAHGGAVGKAGRKQDEVDVVWAACNAAYKKGMIDTAQDFCEGCRKARPERHKGSLRFWHGTPKEPIPCPASSIHDRIEMSGGWQAEWPKPQESARVPHGG